MIRSLFVVAWVMSFGCAQNPFVLEARAAEVCQHLSAKRFEVPPSLRAQYESLPAAMHQGISLERHFEFDIAAQLPPEQAAMIKSRFALTSVRLTAATPGAHLGFVEYATLRLHPAGGGELEGRSFAYVREAAEPTVIAWNGEAFDVAKHLESGTLEYSVSLGGSLPPGDVVVDIDACAEGELKLDAW